MKAILSYIYYTPVKTQNKQRARCQIPALGSQNSSDCLRAKEPPPLGWLKTHTLFLSQTWYDRDFALVWPCKFLLTFYSKRQYVSCDDRYGRRGRCVSEDGTRSMTATGRGQGAGCRYIFPPLATRSRLNGSIIVWCQARSPSLPSTCTTQLYASLPLLTHCRPP